MKRTAAAILLIAILAQSFYSATIYIWFQLNRDYITRAFCVNKARPQLKCGGQCYLAKQLRKADEQNPPRELKEWVEIAPFLVSDTGETPESIAPVSALGYHLETRHDQPHPSGIFHPPLS